MRNLVFVAPGQFSDRNGRRYDTYISFTDKEGDERFVHEGEYFSTEAFLDYVHQAKPRGIVFSFDTQDELEFVLRQVSGFARSIHIAAKHNTAFDLTPLESCVELAAIQLYWNTKQETLWDVKKNPKLKSVEIMDYYRVSDLSAFRGSSVECLGLLGCNGLSSFTSKMHIDEFSFVADMPCLKELRIDIIKDQPSEYYLTQISQCTRLEILGIPDSFFTFQQFAWLKSKLPCVRKGLDGVYPYGKDFYAVIGKRMPKSLQDPIKAASYQKRYDALVESYRNRETPPRDQDKD